METSEQPIPRREFSPSRTDECLEERASIKKQVDELIKSGKGRRNPVLLRPVLGDSHSFNLRPEDVKNWLSSAYPTLNGGEVVEGNVSVSLSHPFRIFRKVMVGTQDSHLVHQPLRQVHITATLNNDNSVGILYHFYLGGNDYPYHTESFVNAPQLQKTDYPNASQLKATDELLKHAEPFFQK